MRLLLKSGETGGVCEGTRKAGAEPLTRPRDGRSCVGCGAQSGAVVVGLLASEVAPQPSSRHTPVALDRGRRHVQGPCRRSRPESAHDLGSHGQEVFSILPACTSGTRRPHEGLIDKRCRLQGVTVAFPGQVAAGDLSQLPIQDGQEFLGRRRHSPGPSHAEAGSRAQESRQRQLLFCERYDPPWPGG